MLQTNPPTWFSNAINRGIAELYAMSLEGCPGADTLPATAALWTDDLWARAAFVESDAPRILQAFRKMRGHLRRWPQQVDFWTNLPSRDDGDLAKLPRSVMTDEDWAANRARLKAIADELFGGKP
jgi:hypothetical protein